MEVKGVGVKTTRDFVKTKFPEKFNTWLNSLPEESQKIYSGIIDVSSWYPMTTGYLIPVEHLINMFYNQDVQTGADDLGRYSAEFALKGIYKVFLLVAAPSHLMNRASKIMSTYYIPSEISVAGNAIKSVTLIINKFDNIDLALEYRIAGWCKRALELTNCHEVNYQIPKSLVKGDTLTEIVFSWS
jgi:hypothetical protein